MSLWVPFSSTSKVSNGWIRNLRFNSRLHKIPIGIIKSECHRLKPSLKKKVWIWVSSIQFAFIISFYITCAIYLIWQWIWLMDLNHLSNEYLNGFSMIGGTSVYKLNIVKLIVFVTLLLSYIGKHQGSPSVTRKLHSCY